MNWFVTGTDTAVGKTYVSCLLLRSLIKSGLKASGYKPLCCGEREDVRLLWEASGGKLPLDRINPVWLRPPAAPYTASIIEDKPIDLDLVRKGFKQLRESHDAVIVEGVGGWLVPITREYWCADLAAEFDIPIVVVVHNRLGALNHTLLTVENIKQRGLTCAGLIINHFGKQSTIAESTNRAILEELTGLPILFEIRQGQDELETALV